MNGADITGYEAHVVWRHPTAVRGCALLFHRVTLISYLHTHVDVQDNIKSIVYHPQELTNL